MAARFRLAGPIRHPKSVGRLFVRGNDDGLLQLPSPVPPTGSPPKALGRGGDLPSCGRPVSRTARRRPRTRMDCRCVGGDPDTQDHAAVAHLVYRGDLMGEDYGVPQRRQQNGSAEPDPFVRPATPAIKVSGS